MCYPHYFQFFLALLIHEIPVPCPLEVEGDHGIGFDPPHPNIKEVGLGKLSP